MQRVILGLKRNGEYKIPKFTECILDYFTNRTNFANVSCVLEDAVLILTAENDGIKLQHSPECPIKIHSQLEIRNEEDAIKPEKKTQNIPVAVSVIVESADHHVLLTKRPKHMRSSPRVWVPPGGHLELGESLCEGGAREIKEETGLNIKISEKNILCLWENVYPLLLGFGPPSNHVLIVYFHVKMNETHQELQKRIKLDPQEVDSNCWLSFDSISELFRYNSTKKHLKEYVIENNSMVEKDLDPNNMFNKSLWQRKESYSGTHFALSSWLEKFRPNEGLPSKF